jgi:hypothetical protein
MDTEGGLAIACSLSSLVSLRTIFLRSTFLIADDSALYYNPIGNDLFFHAASAGRTI